MFDAGERLDKIRAHHFQLAAVMRRQLVQEARALGGNAEQDAARIVLVAGAFEQALLLRAVCQFDDAIVPQAETLGCVGNSGDCAGRRSSDLEEELMLLRLEPGIVGGLLTELHEGAKAIAKFGEALNKACRGVPFLFHKYIVSRHISSQMPLGSAPRAFC
jgi:hypothetical protein